MARARALPGAGRAGRSGPSGSTRTLAVWFADWSAIASGARPDDTVAVVRAERVVAVTPAARAEGLTPGLRRREAQGRCPSLEVVAHDPGCDGRAFDVVVEVLERFSPRLVLSRPGVGGFLTRGPSRYFGGDEALAAQVRAALDEALESLGWRGHGGVGVADTPFAAGLAARRVPVQVVEPGDTLAFLAPLPVSALGRPELGGLLSRLGITTLGAFGALDAGDVLARFGDDGALAHRLARGVTSAPPATGLPPADLVARRDLDPPVDRVDAVAFAAKSAADLLCDRLSATGVGCTQLGVRLETEYGNVCERSWHHDGILGAPAMVDRVRWQLEGWSQRRVGERPDSAVAVVALTVEEVQAAQGRQLGFWGEEHAVLERVQRAAARLEGLLGHGSVTIAEPRGGRAPAERFVRVPLSMVDLEALGTRPSDDGAPDPTRAPWPGAIPTPSPATVHDAPHEVEVLDATGVSVSVDARGEPSAAPASVRLGSAAAVTTVAVVAWAGPWPSEERWWDPSIARRRARMQVVLDDGRALLVGRESGRWLLEASYD